MSEAFILISQDSDSCAIRIEDIDSNTLRLLGIKELYGSLDLLDFLDAKTGDLIKDILDDGHDIAIAIGRARLTKLTCADGRHIPVHMKVFSHHDSNFRGARGKLMFFKIIINEYTLAEKLHLFQCEFRDGLYSTVSDISKFLNHSECIEAIEMCQDFLEHYDSNEDFIVGLATPLVQDAEKFCYQLATIVDSLIHPTDILGQINDDGVLFILLNHSSNKVDEVYKYLKHINKPTAISYARITNEMDVFLLIDKLCESLPTSSRQDEAIPILQNKSRLHILSATTQTEISS